MIVEWILGLNKKEAPSLPAKGSIVPSDKDMGNGNTMVITATYTDKGGAGLRPQSGVGSLTLKSPVVSVATASAKRGINIAEFGGRKLATIENGTSGTLEFDKMNLRNISALELNYSMRKAPDFGYTISWFVDSPNGTKLGEVKIGKDADLNNLKLMVPLQQVPDQPFKLVMKMEKADSKEAQFVAVTSFRLVASK
jgi:hypothetical protein